MKLRVLIWLAIGVLLVALLNVGVPFLLLNLAIDEFLGGGMDPLWRERFTAGGDGWAGSVAVPLPTTGLYQIRLSRTRWAGDVRLRWRVSRRAPSGGAAPATGPPARTDSKSG